MIWNLSEGFPLRSEESYRVERQAIKNKEEMFTFNLKLIRVSNCTKNVTYNTIAQLIDDVKKCLRKNYKKNYMICDRKIYSYFQLLAVSTARLSWRKDATSVMHLVEMNEHNICGKILLVSVIYKIVICMR